VSIPRIVVFGATGRDGAGVVRAILRDPRRRYRARAVTRRPDGAVARALAAAGAEVVAADLDVPATVLRAMDGAHGAYCTTTAREHGSPERELAHACSLAWAAKRSGVAHVVWSTFEDTRDFAPCGSVMPIRKGRYNVPPYDVKGEANRVFVDAGVPTTLLYPSFRWEDLVARGLERQPDGTLLLLLPFGEAPLPGIAAEDVGACAFAMFAAGEDAIGKAVGIAGEHLRGAELAAHLACALGRPVVHAPATPDAFAARPVDGAADLANLFRFKRDFAYAYAKARSVRCTRELHPAALTFAGWLAQHRRVLAERLQ
jgi:uncharacterized protein YbjT (DUF2867 family)